MLIVYITIIYSYVNNILPNFNYSLESRSKKVIK